LARNDGPECKVVKQVTVRAIHRAATVGGYRQPNDTLHLRIYYPAIVSGKGEQLTQAVDETRAPCPVIILLAGINYGSVTLRWLAHKLAENGYAVVTYDWITLDFGGCSINSPGITHKRLQQKHFGKKPSCPAIPTILDELKQCQKKGELAGQLNLKRVILGGHSSGGTMALANANLEWFPQIRGAFSYAADTLGNPQQGWKEGSFMPLSRDIPLLIMGGDCDTLVSHGRGEADKPSWSIEQTFHQAIKGKRGDRQLVIIRGGNHFSLVRNVDSAIVRAGVELPTRGGNKQIRKSLSQLILNFFNHVSTGDALAAAELKGLCSSSHPLVAISESK